MVQAHGLALSIRSAEESETFDLANQTATTITNTVETAFSEPFPLKDMIRITLVVGAGKQARQMYDAKAAHAVTSTLQNSCGFVEDRGASCVMECAGSYKLQHDTGKNLKTVVVFPKVKPPSSSTTDDADPTSYGQNVDTEPPLLSPSSPEYKLAVCTMNTFENMIASKCGTWSQKRNCVAALDDVQNQLSELDGLLMKGTPLNSAQQDLYDSISQLDDKREYVHAAMQQHVEQGKLTSIELNLLRTQNAQRIAQNPNAKKALQRKQLLDSITTTTSLPKLRHHASMGKLYKEMGPLVKLETETRGRLLSIKETQSISRLEEIREELEHLERTSREWFEDDDMYNSRVQETRDEYSRFLPRGGGGGGKGKSSSAVASSGGRSAKTASISASTKTRVPINKWVTPAKGTKSAKKKSKLKKGDLFGAMMMDSDDDDDDSSHDDGESSDEEEENETVEVRAAGTARQGNNKNVANSTKSTSGTSKGQNNTSATSNSGNSNNNNLSSKKKKNKKKKGKGGKASPEAGEGILQSGKNSSSGNESAQNETALSTAISFLQGSVIPLLVALLGWIVSFLFGTNKKKKRKKE